MISINLFQETWCISSSILIELSDIYQAYLEGRDVDFKAFNLTLFPAKPPLFEMCNESTARINIIGPIVKHQDPLFISIGSVSSIKIAEHFLQCLRTEYIKEIILNVDSPGGLVSGIQALANLIYESRGVKPILAICDGQMLSAGYWIGAGADKIYIASETVKVGSIGAISKLKGRRNQPDSDVEVTEFVVGKYKHCESPHREPQPDLTNYKQQTLEHIYNAFINDIAKFRGVSPKTVKRKMADGRVFQGSEAIDAGLVDGFYSLKDYHLHGNVIKKQ